MWRRRGYSFGHVPRPEPSHGWTGIIFRVRVQQGAPQRVGIGFAQPVPDDLSAGDRGSGGDEQRQNGHHGDGRFERQPAAGDHRSQKNEKFDENEDDAGTRLAGDGGGKHGRITEASADDLSVEYSPESDGRGEFHQSGELVFVIQRADHVVAGRNDPEDLAGVRYIWSMAATARKVITQSMQLRNALRLARSRRI